MRDLTSAELEFVAGGNDGEGKTTGKEYPGPPKTLGKEYPGVPTLPIAIEDEAESD